MSRRTRITSLTTSDTAGSRSRMRALPSYRVNTNTDFRPDFPERRRQHNQGPGRSASG
ncbi:hypothetical protein BZL30_0248 [Mycobacterium kansasii]|uniref:Uncharacterized protein n=1 Tax=Mycobacterium kansasii TaxID=1768 RepID=A0A1V3XR72_MYCKA|nr:hypothetical protein BZL30_0248 [Mycobacterium kansasii]